MADRILMLGEKIGIDAAGLGCKRGVDPTFVGNVQHQRLNNALASTSNRFGPVIPGGDWEIEDTVVLPTRWGDVLRGAGGLSRDLGETHFDQSGSDLGSPQVSRLIWKGANNGTMVRADGGGYEISNLHFQGCRVAGAGPEPTGGVYPSGTPGRAQVGLHLMSNDGSGAVQTGAKCHLSHLAFQQCHTGLLVGRNLDDVGLADYAGRKDEHADTIYSDDLHYMAPYVGTHANAGTGVHIRNNQSVGHLFGTIKCHGAPAQCFFMEQGGKTIVQSLGFIGGSGSTGWAVRLGAMNVNTAGVVFGEVYIDAQASGAHFLKSDSNIYGDRYSGAPCRVLSGSIPIATTAVPQIDVGPGKYLIECVNYLRAGSILMTGGMSSGSPCLCHVHLNNCTLDGCNIPQLVSGSSSGAFLLTWTNCHLYRIPSSNWTWPFEDSTLVTEIKGGSWSRLAYDASL